MLQTLDQPTRSSLWINLGAVIGATVLVNGAIFGLGWNTSTDAAPRASFSPPDYVVGLVWIVLLGLLATARWWLNASREPDAARAKNWITALLVSCLLWPAYSLAIGSLIGGLIGNIWTIGLAGGTIYQISRLSHKAPSLATPAMLLVAPVIPWVSFASLIVAKQLGWF